MRNYSSIGERMAGVPLESCVACQINYREGTSQEVIRTVHSGIPDGDMRPKTLYLARC